MPRKKLIKPEVILKKREPGFFKLTIKKGDTIIFNNNKLDKLSFYKIYFKDLETNIKNHQDWKAEDFLNAYKNLWSKFTILSRYVDSYGHLWNNTMPPDKWLIQYLNESINLSRT